jgi:hypothetical protein
VELPWILHAAFAAQALPVLAGARYGARLPRVRKWVAGACALGILADSVQLVIAQSDPHVQTMSVWVTYVSVGVENAIFLWALSLWQTHPLLRLAYRMSIPLFVIGAIALTTTLSGANVFNLYTAPFQSLVVLAGALYTLVTHSITEHERITQFDWFWICLGLSAYFALGVALPPFAQILLADRMDLVRLAYLTKAWSDVIAYILIARGMLCPLPRPAPGGSF